MKTIKYLWCPNCKDNIAYDETNESVLYEQYPTYDEHFIHHIIHCPKCKKFIEIKVLDI